jgi:hypothetical protein
MLCDAAPVDRSRRARIPPAMTAYVKVFGCRPFTDACHRLAAGPASENLGTNTRRWRRSRTMSTRLAPTMSTHSREAKRRVRSWAPYSRSAPSQPQARFSPQAEPWPRSCRGRDSRRRWRADRRRAWRVHQQSTPNIFSNNSTMVACCCGCEQGTTGAREPPKKYS